MGLAAFFSQVKFKGGARNSMGSVISKEHGPKNGLPAYVTVPNIFPSFGAGFLGGAYGPFIAGDPNVSGYKVRDLTLPTDRPAEILLSIGRPRTTDRYRVDIRVPEGTTAGLATIQLTTASIAGPEVTMAIQ